MTHSTAALRRAIEHAFAGTVPPPQPVPPAPVGSSGHAERQQLAAAFVGKSWRDVSAAVAQHHHDTLPFFSDEGFRHFLPAWLRGALEPDTDLDFYALQALRPALGAAERPAFERRMAGFTAEQRAVIAAFLAHLAPDDFDADALAAARSYWA
jgi:hypothetical protein